MSYKPIYAVYRAMLDRCNRPNHQAYHNYGGRGISVCDRWQESFTNFYKDMGPTYQEGLTLDRTDNMGNYTPENCRWVLWQPQMVNKRPNVWVDTPHGKMTLSQISDMTGIGRSTIHYRWKAGVREWEQLTCKPDTRNWFMTSSTAGQETDSSSEHLEVGR
jgi:hypothetical protein